jgi:hypothetical protein
MFAEVKAKVTEDCKEAHLAFNPDCQLYLSKEDKEAKTAPKDKDEPRPTVVSKT